MTPPTHTYPSSTAGTAHLAQDRDLTLGSSAGCEEESGTRLSSPEWVMWRWHWAVVR